MGRPLPFSSSLMRPPRLPWVWASSSPTSGTARHCWRTKWICCGGKKIGQPGYGARYGIIMSSEYFLQHAGWIPLFPLVSAALMLFLGRRLPKFAVNLFCVGSVFVSFIFSAGAVYQLAHRAAEERFFQKILFVWIPAGVYHTTAGPLANFAADWGILLDPLSSVMILIVTGVGFLIHVYATGYMAHEGGYYRFFGYLNLFMFSMLTLVLANNLLLMFVGWEGVGLCSYLLIGFYFLRKSAADAGMKAFIVNRVGDAGFLLGMFT